MVYLMIAIGAGGIYVVGGSNVGSECVSAYKIATFKYGEYGNLDAQGVIGNNLKLRYQQDQTSY